MARPKKSGLSYFPFDIDFFEDECIAAVGGEFGALGELTAIRLLCAIYRRGYYIEWSEMLKMKLLRQISGISADVLERIVGRLVEWGYFDAAVFAEHGVLTSGDIQQRYFQVVRSRTAAEEYPYLLEKQAAAPEKKNKKAAKTCEAPVAAPTAAQPEKTPPAPPKISDVMAFFEEHPDRPPEWRTEARMFFSYFDSMGWRNTRGTPIDRWQSKADYWILDKKQKKTQSNNTTNENRQSDRFSERRGTEPLTKRYEEFNGTF